MKKIIILLASLAVLLSASSCGSLSQLSDKEAFDLGWNIGYYGTKLLNN